MKTPQAIRGTQDIFGAEAEAFAHVVSVFERVRKLYRFTRIEMPVFSSRRVTTALTIYDGYTVAVGGLMREDVQMVEDSVPILGDIPIVGRLFQTKAENRIKSNLIIFVTAQIIDATGRPIRGGQDLPPVDPSTPAVGGGDEGVLPVIAE